MGPSRRAFGESSVTTLAIACLASIIGLTLIAASCGSGDPTEMNEPDTTTVEPPQALYTDVTATHLPGGILAGLSMDAGVGDFDADGDLDIVIAHEFRPNILLLNDGTGRFSDGSSRLPVASHDSEDVGVADFDGDGDLDIVVVTEDDRTNELYFNDGTGRFTDEGRRLPVEGTTNGVVVADLNGDGFSDILLANNGQDAVLINDGAGSFVDETADRLPQSRDVTQDLELGDVDGDGDPDLIVANEGANVLYINDGTGHFGNDGQARIPLREGGEETREADFGDVDGDGDLDLLFANVSAFVSGADPRNRLLINNGMGFFADESATRLPAAMISSFDGDLVDVDGDGDLDVVTANADVDLSVGRIADSRYRAYLNDGNGVFTEASADIFGSGVTGTGFDLEFADFDGDGRPDFYLASRGTADRLLLRH